MENQLNIWKNKKWNKKKMENIFLSINELSINIPLEIIKVSINNRKIKFFKNNKYQNKRGSKLVILRKFLNDVLLKFSELECVFYLILNEHVTADKYFININDNNLIYSDSKIKKIDKANKIYRKINEYPFFSFVKPKDSNLICMPDTIFLNDYSKWSRSNNNIGLNDLIIKYNKKSRWENKKDSFIFKSNYWKYYEIKNTVKKKIKNMNINNDFIPIKNQIKYYKYFIGTFLRWDTSYWQLLSNSPVFIINKINNKTLDTHPVLYKSFLSFYFEPYIDYIPIQLDRINKVYEKYKNKDDKLKKIALNSTMKTKELTYNKIVNDFGNLLLNFKKIYDEK